MWSIASIAELVLQSSAEGCYQSSAIHLCHLHEQTCCRCSSRTNLTVRRMTAAEGNWLLCSPRDGSIKASEDLALHALLRSLVFNFLNLSALR